MIKLRVPAKLEFRGVAMRTVAAACQLARTGQTDVNTELDDVKDLDLTDKFDSELVSAFSEIFNNIAIHGFKDGSGDIQIELNPIENGVTMTISDHGASFALAEQEDPDLDALPEGGMGLFIARAFVNEFVYTPGKPNVLVMTKLFES